jgi:hypothetical protein
MRAYSTFMGELASILNVQGSVSATLGSYQRRAEEWKFQEKLAAKEIDQIEKQIIGAEIRKAVAEQELKNHDLQVENAKEADVAMHDKFTNKELYDWMVGQISSIYFQSYQLSYDVAKRAERTYRHELGLRDSSFIQFGYWDSLKKGLLAGEKLYHDLKRMEVGYLDQNKREYEITKHVSLLQLDPLALIQLKQAGECFVSLPEVLFDLDYPGHYLRRIKAISITVPCVTGPYTGVNCTLTLLKSSFRRDNRPGGQYGRYKDGNEDSRFTDSRGAIQSIVTSTAQNDSGLFETNLRDERYLPFEGTGVISDWHLELPKDFRAFDYDTISDVVLHLRYTAREGGGPLKRSATDALTNAVNDLLNAEGQHGLARLFSLRHEFPTEWHKFLNPTKAYGDQTITLDLTDRFPQIFSTKSIAIDEVKVFIKVNKQFAETHNKDSLQVTLAAGNVPPTSTTAKQEDMLSLTHWNNLIRGAKELKPSPNPDTNLTMNAWLKVGNKNNPTISRFNPKAIEDVVFLCHYTVKEVVAV